MATLDAEMEWKAIGGYPMVNIYICQNIKGT